VHSSAVRAAPRGELVWCCAQWTRPSRTSWPTSTPASPRTTAVIRRSPRSAEVRADTDVELLVLSRAAFASLDHTDPALRITLLENLLRHVAQMVALLDREVATMAG
jgi:hypothetical protein